MPTMAIKFPCDKFHLFTVCCLDAALMPLLSRNVYCSLFGAGVLWTPMEKNPLFHFNKNAYLIYIMLKLLNWSLAIANNWKIQLQKEWTVPCCWCFISDLIAIALSQASDFWGPINLAHQNTNVTRACLGPKRRHDRKSVGIEAAIVLLQCAHLLLLVWY